jgi:hypothetical protein
MALLHRSIALATVLLVSFPTATFADSWAVVTADGSLARGSGVQSSTRTGTGAYTVTFKADVAACTYQATIGSHVVPRLPGGRPVGGMVSVAPRFSTPNAVRVYTRDRLGVAKSRGFHLLVTCPPVRNTAAVEPRTTDADRWAVVSFDSIVAGRGAASAAFIPADTGNKGTEVVFDKNVRQCAYLGSQVTPESDPYRLGVGPRWGKSGGVHVSSALTSTAGPAGEFNLLVKCATRGATKIVNDRWAVVNANGTLVRGFGARASARLSLGRYAVDIDKRRFGWPAGGRAALVTIGTANASLIGQPPTGVATFLAWGEETDTSIGFMVQTWKPNPDDPSDLIGADLPFHLLAVGY